MQRFRSFRWVVPAIAACLLVLWISEAQAAGKTTFRDLARKFYKDGDGSDLAKLVGYTQPVKKVIALDYKVLLFQDGRETPVDPKTYEFKVGDKIRILVEPLSDYYVYMFHIGASGQNVFLLPSEDEDPPLTERNTPVRLPDDGFFEFVDPPGDEQLYVVAAEKPIENREVLASVLVKKPGEALTPEEKAIKSTLKATVKKALKSVRERQNDIMNKTVTWRGLATDEAREKLVTDVRARSVTQGTFEEPSESGTSAMYISATEEKNSRLLVNIPLRSVSAKKSQ